MKVVSNATPLIHLAKIGKLDILTKLFPKLIIPREVSREVVIRGKAEARSEIIAIEAALSRGEIIVQNIASDQKIAKFASELDKGEVEVLSLARKICADIVLMDEAAGRKVAEALGLNVKGTLFVLLKAHKKKLLTKTKCRQCVDKLIATGFRLAPELYARVCAEIGTRTY